MEYYTKNKILKINNENTLKIIFEDLSKKASHIFNTYNRKTVWDRADFRSIEERWDLVVKKLVDMGADSGEYVDWKYIKFGDVLC